MNKWVVRKQLLGTDWFVWLRGHPQRWRFVTWREAVAFADRRSRTVAVTLPTPEAHPPVDVHRPAWHVSESMNRPWVAPIGRFVHVSDRRGWGELIEADTVERYALTLLAAAKHAKGDLP